MKNSPRGLEGVVMPVGLREIGCFIMSVTKRTND